jgi:hypothetical protein
MLPQLLTFISLVVATICLVYSLGWVLGTGVVCLAYYIKPTDRYERA